MREGIGFLQVLSRCSSEKVTFFLKHSKEEDDTIFLNWGFFI